MAQRVEVGEILGAFGVKGWIKVRSFTQNPEDILEYSPWLLLSRSGIETEHRVCEGQANGDRIMARLEGMTDRDQAAALTQTRILVSRDCFPRAEPGSYYWSDLAGMKVLAVSGQELGVVKELFETGANDVLVVQGEKEVLIPFVTGRYVMKVDLTERLIIVDWDPDF